LPANIILQLTGALLIAVSLASIAGGYLAQQIAHPLEGLADAAISITNGNLRVRAPANSKIKELQGLGQTFNSMTESLRQSDEAKKTFIANVTHELRTPLTVIKGTIETLEDGALDDLKGRRPLLTSMGRETDRMIRLVNELLILTRADAGALQLEIHPVDLLEHAKQRCDYLMNLSTRKNIKIITRSDNNSQSKSLAPEEAASSFMVLADPDRLSQVLDNLLDNAIRHSPPSSTITVKITRSTNSVDCSISDEGTGIPAEHLPFIFERFYRVDKSRDRKDGGTGLGLAIARALVQAHGGTISAYNDEGKGATITFRMPSI
jgi:signal transduction histidine kinase